MAHAAATWARMTEMLESGDVSDMTSLYHQDAVYLEPFNPPHRGNLLIKAYVKDWLVGKTDLDVTEVRQVESADGETFAVEWTLSYDAAGRRWSELPRATILEFDTDTGRIVYQRDYT